jgi:hypothetical protein
MSERSRRFLLRIAGDGKGGISEERLEQWLRRHSRRPVTMADGRTYQIVQGPDVAPGRATFKLVEVKNA